MSQEKEKVDARAVAAAVLAEVLYCLCFYPRRAPSLRKEYRELARRLGGIWYQARDDTYHLERKWRDNLEFAGLSFEAFKDLNLELIRDPEKFQRAVQQAVNAKAERKERMRRKKLVAAIEIRQIGPVKRETTAESLGRLTNRNVFQPKLNELVRTRDGGIERNRFAAQAGEDMDTYVPRAPAKATSVRRRICGPNFEESDNGLTLHE